MAVCVDIKSTIVRIVFGCGVILLTRRHTRTSDTHREEGERDMKISRESPRCYYIDRKVQAMPKNEEEQNSNNMIYAYSVRIAHAILYICCYALQIHAEMKTVDKFHHTLSLVTLFRRECRPKTNKSLNS